MVKSEADYLSKQVDKARSQLVLDFEAWYAAEYEGRGADVNESMMGGGADVSAEGEVMDDGEKFDRLEVERVMAHTRQRLGEAEKERLKMQALVEQDLIAVRKDAAVREQRQMDELGVMQFNLGNSA